MNGVWHNPFVVGLVGLALMITGWKVGSIPPAEEGPDATARRLNVVREHAERGELPENPKPVQMSVPQGPPYRLIGRLTFYAGLLLFVVAAVQMWTHPVPPKEDADKQEEPHEPPDPNEPGA